MNRISLVVFSAYAHQRMVHSHPPALHGFIAKMIAWFDTEGATGVSWRLNRVAYLTFTSV